MPHRKHKLLDLLNRSKSEILNGAEVGVQFATTAAHVLGHLPSLHLYLIDSYEEQNWIGANHTVQAGREAAENKLASFKDRTTWLLMRSVDAAKHVGDRSLDYAFIDAKHTYEAVRQDIAAWFPKIRPGGILAGHDYCKRFRGVQRAVNELFGDKLQVWGDVWWVYVSELREVQ